MTIILFRIFILISFVILIYTAYQYYRNPQRRLRKAKVNNKFLFIDEPSNTKKNLQFVYNGCLFEGEKYLGTIDDAFDVLDIHIIVHDRAELRGLTRNDLMFLEKEVLTSYPHATIKWKHPIDKLLA